MKKIFFFSVLLIPFLINAQLAKTLVKTIELKMPREVDITEGSESATPLGIRGGAVAWHSIQKKYYAAFVGNFAFPLAVFDSKGKILSDLNLTTMDDLRGLWYNSKLKKISGNGFNEIGWFSYKLDNKGIPADYKIDFEGMNQPNTQSIGVYNKETNKVCFLDGQFIYQYSADNAMVDEKTIRLYPGIIKATDIDKDDFVEILSKDYNYNVLIYTGIPKAEFGILNVYEKQVELYNQKTGLMTQKLKLPTDIPLWTAFNFSYANGIYWAFDQDTRTWTGYK